MAQIKVALSIERDWTGTLFYSQGKARGVVFKWEQPHASSRQLFNLGLDVCGFKRWEYLLTRTPEVAARAFTPRELQWASGQPERLARVWAIKEAVVKTLGCGFAGLAYHEVEVEFALHRPILSLPATLPGNTTAMRDFAGQSWQLILFVSSALSGALVCTWQPVADPVAQASSIALELRPIQAGQQGTRREQADAERQAALKAVRSAASRILPVDSHQQLAIRKFPSGRPWLQFVGHERIPTCLSLSHCSGWAAAALGGFSPT
jgi:phosphopantetheinyl transferase (holo-ACP synthase)